MSVSNMNEIRKVALVTGITGQDGSYLAELLLEKGYEVRTIPSKHTPQNECDLLPIWIPRY